MSDAFPQQLQEAATKWRNYCTSFAQLLPSGNQILVRMQAPQIMWEFVGSVQFGKDPLGILFYHAQSDFEVNEANFRVTYYPGSNSLTTVKIDFFEDGSPSSPFARWVCRVDTKVNVLPPPSNQVGSGTWRSFKAFTSEAWVHKITNSARVRLRFRPVGKQVYFNSVVAPDAISAHGTMIAVDLLKLNGPTSVDYAPDRIVFFRTGSPADVLALFLPGTPLPLKAPPGSQPPPAVWSEYIDTVNSDAPRGFAADFPDPDFRTQALPESGDLPEDLHELADDYAIEGL